MTAATRSPVRAPGDPTQHQLYVLDRVSHGQTDEQISRALVVTATAVRHCCARMFTRLGADNRAHAVRIGFERGLLLSSNPAPLTSRLSRREQHVLDLISWGHTNEQVGARLHVSPHYAKQLATDLYRTLGASTRGHAVRLGFEHGLLKPNQRWGGAS